MTSETDSPTRITQPTTPTHHFAMRFSSTPRGARLARRLAGQRLDAWGIPYDSDAHDALTLIVAELAANAVRHGRVPGRDFRLALALALAAASDTATVRVEVTDTRTERVPALAAPAPDRDSGRGLLLVECLATRWAWHPRADGPGKTVWAEYVLPTGA
ncbi:ATP-binding protein [Streptomyces sp. A3M-1-3]|uniref:ATP-binding protein n=1 Tax=Streptomyces sp. A3M-1-3 TaxID=2962044 RepID=UPI0020B87AC4|nr:ATP-binding protein [Streptomyces sp. A3M-1-3]MCP3818392.1 ATP-binding protein [Streptomyces sp. A3M-1-3]